MMKTWDLENFMCKSIDHPRYSIYNLKMLLLVPPACEQCWFLLHSIELGFSPAGQFTALRWAGFMCWDALVDILPGFHPFVSVYEWEAFIHNSLVYPVSMPSSVYHEENRWHRWALWHASFHGVALQDVACNYNLHYTAWEKAFYPLYNAPI
jgi:hypothetical protein